MAQPNDPYNLLESWRALSVNADGEGWRTIPLDIKGNCMLMAGRYYPENVEAILLGFQSVVMPANKHFPQGHGFRVEKIESSVLPGKYAWIALSRLSGGSIELYAVMAQDILTTLDKYSQDSENSIFQVFLGRIRAWQSFMDKSSDSILSPEAEIGLFGELTILEKMMQAGLLPSIAVESWIGPLDGLQDFSLGKGGIEAKTTIKDSSFLVKISSLEQLDSTLVCPLYLAGIKLALSDTGLLLPEFIEQIRCYFSKDSLALNTYECLLLQAGFFSPFAEQYTRRFKHLSTNVYEVNDTFPRLTAANVVPEIVKANYEIDLARVSQKPFTIEETLAKLRGI